MRLLSALLSLSAFLSVHLAAANSTPCLQAKSNDDYNIFQTHYLPSNPPDNYEAWRMYLKQHTKCDNTFQSFFSHDDRNSVENICKEAKELHGNYCISKKKFTFTSVDSELGTCVVRKTTEVTKHIIVACDVVEDVCRPTSLEENRNNLEPTSSHPDCVAQDPTAQDPTAQDPTMSCSFMIRAAGQLTLLALAFSYLMG